MKKLLFAAALVCLASCGSGDGKETGAQPKPASGLQKTEGGAAATGGLIAYVEMDTLLQNYSSYKASIEALTQERKNIETQANTKTQQLQQQYQKQIENLQAQVQQGKISQQAAAQSAQQIEANLSKQGETAASQYQKQVAAWTQKDSLNTAKYTEEIHAFLADYNKDGRYSIILAKSGLNILYARPELDITQDVLEGLNKKAK